MLAAIWVTYSCNMKCKYCYEGQDKKIKSMNKDIAIQSLKYIFKRVTNKNDIVGPMSI